MLLCIHITFFTSLVVHMTIAFRIRLEESALVFLIEAYSLLCFLFSIPLFIAQKSRTAKRKAEGRRRMRSGLLIEGWTAECEN